MGGKSILPTSERSERSSLGGVKDHERSEYLLSLERQEFVVRNGALAEWRMTISERKYG